MPNVTFNNYTPPKNTKVEHFDIRIGLFFDGTRNNKTNTNSKDKPSNKESSYYNDWSNVARLWDFYDKDKRIYVEGIGTTDNSGDDTQGYAFGSGFTGIPSKVWKGSNLLVDKIQSLQKAQADKQLRNVILDVYGFSRGAAAARHFTYLLGKAGYEATSKRVGGGRASKVIKVDIFDKQVSVRELPAGGQVGLKIMELGLKIPMTNIRINMLGIFDTVSSYHPRYSVSPNFDNDVNQLGLNNLGKATNVVHFTANDEIRENFSLTKSPKGVEKGLPGVHSDVGGSYTSGKEIIEEIETTWGSKFNLDPYKTKLLNLGWYKDGELTITGGNVYWALRGEKSNVYKQYSFIPLHFMTSYAVKYKCPFNKDSLEAKYSIQSFNLLKNVKTRLESYVMDDGVFPYSRNMKGDVAKELHDLRYSFLHRSARREGIGMDPNNDWKRVNH